MKPPVSSSIFFFLLLPFSLLASSRIAETCTPSQFDCDSFTLTLVSLENITCFNSIGYIEVEGAGGAPPYSYTWSVPGVSENFIEVSVPGSYTVTISDTNGCTLSETYTIAQIEGPTIDAIYVSPESCHGSCDGVIELHVSGGTPPYHFLNHPGTCGGLYIVYVIDAEGCLVTEEVFISTIEEIEIDFLAIRGSHPGQYDGTVEIFASGGTTPYQYSLDSIFYQDTNVFTNLAPGNYCVRIRDENGCIEKSEEFEIQELTALDNVRDDNFTLYPNPADDILFVEAEKPVSVRITDFFGNTIIVVEKLNRHQMNTTNFIPGIYVVEITDDVVAKYQKLVIR